MDQVTPDQASSSSHCDGTDPAKTRCYSSRCSASLLARVPSLPNHPWSVAGIPKGLEVYLLAQCVHTLPKLVVLICGQLPQCRPASQVRRLPNCNDPRSGSQRHLRLEDKKTAINPSRMRHRLLGEIGDNRSVQNETTEASRGRTAVTVASLPCSR